MSARSAASLLRRLSPAPKRGPVFPAMAEPAAGGPAARAPIPDAVRYRNMAVATALLAFVGSVYYYSISRMRQRDELTDIIERERQTK